MGDTIPAMTRARSVLRWRALRRTLCLIAFIALLSVELPARATDLTVSTTADAVNGDTSSPAALIANPGPDGISLREALLAASNAPGPHTIDFAPALASQTIVLTSRFAPITRDQITLTGLTDNGQPTITIVSQPASADCTFFVAASQFKLSGLRFTFAPFNCAVIQIGGFGYGLQGQLVEAPPHITDIQISDNAFSNPGSENNFGFAIMGGGTATNAIISNVRIVRNVFQDFADCGICIGASGTNHTIRDVTISHNTFGNVVYPVELGTGTGSGNRVVGGRVVDNTIVDAVVPIALIHGELRNTVPPASGNLIEDSLISRNAISGTFDSVIVVGGQSNATDNAIRNTQILNNVIATGRGINIVGGEIRGGGSPTGNVVDGVRIVNNTLVTSPLAGVRVDSNLDGSTGNTVSGVSVANTIFVGGKTGPEDEIAGEITPAQVAFSLTRVPGFVGVNGNVSGDPKFVSPAQGDFHLQAGSPAIDAGTSDGAPTKDLECRTRFDDPATPNTGGGTSPFFDMGAFEFGGGAPDCSSQVMIERTGSGTGVVSSSPGGIDCGATCAASFQDGTDVTLTATPGTGTVFSGWSGPCTGNDVCRLSAFTDVVVTASFLAGRTLTVASSNPGSGVSITVSPNDNNGFGSGTTQFTRTYNNNTVVNLTTPSTAGGNNFQKWQRDGVDWAFTQSTNLTMDANLTMTAVYVTPPPITRTLTVASSNPGSGVSITVSPNDNNGFGSGTTQFSRTYNNNTAVTLTAPSKAGGKNFSNWSGCDNLAEATCNVTMSADKTVTATFVDTLPLTLAGPLPTGEVNLPFSAPLVSGGAAPYNITRKKGAFPPGLSGDPSTGNLAGNPAAAKSGTFTVQVSDQLGSSMTGTFKFKIVKAVSISTSSLKPGKQGKAYNAVLRATGGATPYSWSLTSGSPPAWMNFDSGTGRLAGTPTDAGTFNVTFQVSDSLGGQAQKSFTLTVK